jgi:transposase
MHRVSHGRQYEGRDQSYYDSSVRAELEKLSLAPWASRRRLELLELLDRMNPTIEELTAAVEEEARKRPEALRLMTHPGVGPLTALAYVLIIGTPTRFACAKQIGSYVGLIPSEDSSGGKQRLGHISKAVLCCASCWWRQHRRPYVVMRTGAVVIETWPCVGRGTLRK